MEISAHCGLCLLLQLAMANYKTCRRPSAAKKSSRSRSRSAGAVRKAKSSAARCRSVSAKRSRHSRCRSRSRSSRASSTTARSRSRSATGRRATPTARCTASSCNLNHTCTNVCENLTLITRSSATAEIARVGGHHAVQGHSRSLILVLIESPYVSSC